MFVLLCVVLFYESTASRWADPPSREFYQMSERAYNFKSISVFEQAIIPNT
jgi:hypothetical protein